MNKKIIFIITLLSYSLIILAQVKRKAREDFWGPGFGAGLGTYGSLDLNLKIWNFEYEWGLYIPIKDDAEEYAGSNLKYYCPLRTTDRWIFSAFGGIYSMVGSLPPFDYPHGKRYWGFNFGLNGELWNNYFLELGIGFLDTNVIPSVRLGHRFYF